jgi:hypothetical protein
VSGGADTLTVRSSQNEGRGKRRERGKRRGRKKNCIPVELQNLRTLELWRCAQQKNDEIGHQNIDP